MKYSSGWRQGSACLAPEPAFHPPPQRHQRSAMSRKAPKHTLTPDSAPFANMERAQNAWDYGNAHTNLYVDSGYQERHHLLIALRAFKRAARLLKQLPSTLQSHASVLLWTAFIKQSMAEASQFIS